MGSGARHLTIAVERFPIAGRFTIARGSRTEAVVVTATVTQGSAAGCGECVPYARYRESAESVVSSIEIVREAIEAGADRGELQHLLPAGAARNALDCALWDLEAKRSGVPAHVSAGIDRPRAATTAYTLSLNTPDAMAEAARRAADRPILKIKLGAPDGDLARIEAVRQAAPAATLIADANEGWTDDNLALHLDACARAGFALVEQPLPAGRDEALRTIAHPVPICADESLHERGDLDRLAGLYEAINIKLDKAGGLTEALELAKAAEARGLAIMVGCMVGTSLAMAPAMLLAPRARFVDLDGPLLLARDRENGLSYDGSVVQPPSPSLWG
jgi:L-alanine-DL-glutamate epimerase-like enolase superfamily enzyme